MKGKLATLEEGPQYTSNIYINFPSLSQKDLQFFTKITVHLGKGNNQPFGGTTTHWLWMDTDSGRPQSPCGPPVWAGGLWRSGDQWGFNWGPSHRKSSGPLNPSYGCFRGSALHNWNRHAENLAEPHIGSLIHGVRDIMVERPRGTAST